jgi:signal transduction histidine kinase
MPVAKRQRKTQEHPVTREDASKSSYILSRVLDEVGDPLDEAMLQCQRLLEGAAGKLTIEQRKAVESISEIATRSAQRLRDYVDLMLLEAGDLALRPKPHNLSEAIDEAVRELRPLARAKGVNLVVEDSLAPLPPVLADPARVTQVLANLIGNAIKFTDRGQVTISTEPYDRSVAVHIVDTGVGIPAGEIPKLYEDFFQGDGASAREPRGGGLGITLSRRLVIRIGGDLWASSTVGAGSKFSFTVPRVPGATAPSRLAPV